MRRATLAEVPLTGLSFQQLQEGQIHEHELA
jgi:hypothetical protein